MCRQVICSRETYHIVAPIRGHRSTVLEAGDAEAGVCSSVRGDGGGKGGLETVADDGGDQAASEIFGCASPLCLRLPP